jgi:hypothetical protein
MADVVCVLCGNIGSYGEALPHCGIAIRERGKLPAFAPFAMHFPGLLERSPHKNLEIKNNFLPASTAGIDRQARTKLAKAADNFLEIHDDA